MMQLNALLHVTQSKFNPCKSEIVCRGIATADGTSYISGCFSCIALTGYISVKLLMILLFICVT